MKPINFSKVSALVASAAAVSQADTASAQQGGPFVPGATTYTFEGGVLFSNYSNTGFPAGAVPFVPQALGKVGAPLWGSATLILAYVRADMDRSRLPGISTL